MSGHSKMHKNPATVLVTGVNRERIALNHEHETWRAARIMDLNQKGVNTMIGERA